jgi:pimeloyl-ACP methyl ester carboxylesterase
MSVKALGGMMFKGMVLTSAGMFAASEFIRRMDHRKSRGLQSTLPNLPEAEKRDGIYSQDGTPIHVDCCGEGPTVFFVHGLACNNTIWRYQKAYFSKMYRVVSMDLRGHGKSGIPQNVDLDTERMAEDLEAVLEAFDPEEFVIVGHSMGGFTTFKWHRRFGDRYQGRLKGLVFVDSSGIDVVEGIVFKDLVKRLYPFPLAPLLSLWKRKIPLAQKAMDIFGETAPAYLFARYVAFGERPPANEVEFQRQLIFSTPLPCFAMATKACLDYHMGDYLPNMDVPVLILVGSKDRLTAKTSSERTCQMLPRATLKVYEGCGHDTMLECPERLNEDIHEFLRDCFA